MGAVSGSRGRYAIVGYGFRMPGGIYTAEGFWQLLTQREFVREPIARRYGRGYEPVLGNPGPSRFAACYEGLMRGDEPYMFDCRLFGMSTREASVMDPQMRMLLTCTWEALEQAGRDQAGLRNSRTGVFIGAQISSSGNWRPLLGPDEFVITGTSLDMLPNRISYAFNLMGPSAAYLTACSSGATAMHAAITALNAGDCDQAVVGASSFLGSALASAGFGQLGVISPDSGCRSFDATANGYMRAEGVFVYLVKPLAAAERDGDRILAVIAGTAVNTAGAADGAAGSGPGRMITAPTQHAQVELMRAACARAGLSPNDVDYIEAHATGTRVGDRIEGNAIREVFGGETRTVPLRVASVKSNVGHMEAAAFTCALLKALLMFEHRMYAPISRHYAVPNPDIDFTGLRVQTECESFGEGPVTIGINSFGFGGANGHCLLTEYRPEREPAYSRPVAPDAAYLVPLSARTPEALKQSAAALREVLAEEPDFDLYTLAGNLSRRRTHFAARTAFAATGLPELIERLEAFAEDPLPVSTVSDAQTAPRVLMVFAGQGTQWAGCGRELYQTEPVFRRAVDAVDAAWRGHAGFSLRDACFTASSERLDQCQLAQPVIFMIEVALVELLKTWGVYAGCVIGHSAGEVAAAYAAGLCSLEEATRLVFHRATLQQRTAGSGRMLAVSLDRAGAEEIVREAGARNLEIACENAPAGTVICGPGEDVARAVALLEERHVPHRLLRGNVAFHSAAMDVLEGDLRASLAFLDARPLRAEVPFVSSVTGEVTENLDTAYWWSNVRRPVRFMTAVRTAARDVRPDVVLEISPHTTLTPAVRQTLAGQARPPACVRTLAREEDPRLSFQQALAGLYRAGVGLDFAARYPRVRPVSHLLPRHPKDEHLVIDPLVDDAHFLRRGEYSAGPLVGRRIPGPEPRFEVRMSAADFPWLTEHRVQYTPIMPAAGYVEMILQALGSVPAHFELVEFLRPCLLREHPVRLQTELAPQPGPGGAFTFRISSLPIDDTRAGESVLHCTGKVRIMPNGVGESALATLDRGRFADAGLGSREAFYGRMSAVIGEYFQYGPRFQAVQGVRQDVATSELLLELGMDDALWHDGRRAGYLLPPSLLDGGLQAFLYYLMQCSDVSAVPRRMEGLTVDRLPASPRLLCHFVPPGASARHERGQLSLAPGENPCGSLTLYDEATGERVAHLASYTGFHANPKQDTVGRTRHVVRWRPKFVPDGPPPARADLTGVIDALARRSPDGAGTLRVAEFTQSVRPEDTAAAGYLRHDPDGGRDPLAPSAPGDPVAELWLLGASAADTQRLYEAFGQGMPPGAAARFGTADLSDPALVDLRRGLLRPSACDLVVVDAEAVEVTAATWDLIRRLLVPGGLALLRHPDSGFTQPGHGWSRIAPPGTAPPEPAPSQIALPPQIPEQGSLWAAPLALPAPLEDGPAPGPRWLIAGRGSLGELWVGPRGARRMDPWTLDPDWLAASETQAELRALRAIDFFCDEPGGHDPSGERLVTRFLALVRALAVAKEGQTPAEGPAPPQGPAAPDALPETPCRLTVITRRAAFDVASPRAAALWGAVRALGHELGSRLDLRLVDVSEPSDLPVLGWLARHDVRERELAVSGGRLYTPRLVSRPGAQATFPASQGDPYRLCVTSPGQVTGLSMLSQPDEPLAPDEVEIDVAAAALNFRDLMVTLDLLPLASYERSALGRQVGIEASGVIRRTGSAVTSRRVGERVVFMKGGCIANRVHVHERAVFPQPGPLSAEESAAALSVYVTAYHALVDLARLRAGQQVLVHSAMGGVGQAAIALARYAGATVYATAGTPEKRAKLLGLGVAGAFDSHSFGWYDDLLEATGGEGVDVVLNSLAGHHIALCLQALRPGGWHCEIGKVDIYADAALGLSVFRKNVRFAAIDVDRLMHDDPERCRELTAACLRLLADGAVPPLPVTSYRYADYPSAFRFMASGQHEGKLVLTDPGATDLAVTDRRPFLDPDATYLVTGGLGGFGLHLLAYLVSAGARHLTLLDRYPARRRDADWVRHASGIAHFFPGDTVEIDIVPGDVSRRDDVDRCLAGLRRSLKGVFHLAAILDDHPLADVTPESVAATFAPKAGGAWHLHQATAGLPLDHFVLLSSIAAVFGNAGQSVYAAANAYLDGLAEYRRGLGLPALAYNMAGVAEAGMAARTPHVLRLMRAAGMPPVSTALAIANLDFALRAMPGESHLVSAEIGRLPGSPDHPDYMRTGRWMAGDGGAEGGVGALPAEAIVREICHEIAKLSGEEQVGPTETIASFGVNSLSVAELIAFVMTRFNHHVSALDLMTTATPESIATAIIRARTNPDPVDPSAPATDPSAAAASTPGAASPGTASGGSQALPSAGPWSAEPPVAPPVRRPSVFANTWADHFPAGADLEFPATADREFPAGAVGDVRASGLPPAPRPARLAVASADRPRPRPLAGALPEQCQQDLELLQNTIRTLTGGSPVPAPMPADRFGAVFLTGATGFVGRFVLSELLRQTDHVVVHCLVRAESRARGLERIVGALDAAQLWDDAYAGRIRVWPGDIRAPRFGLPEQDFGRLCDQIDAVYHLAADLNLLSSYAAMREANTRSFRNVLELALLRRTKHVFYASTMGVFPQYFCNFANGFGGQGIEDEAQPDLDLMKSVFPPGLVGYPWSKLVVEQSLLSGQSLGLPVAIMRLPQMGIAAGSGYTQSSDIKIRIVMAVLDSGVMPSGFRLQWTEPVDTVSELLTGISLNPRRQHTIYHLCHPAPQTWGLELADFGFDVREVSYAEFRRACQARGRRGPLHGYWPLVDHFARHWFADAAAQARPAAPQVRPVSADAVAADAPDAPAWPGIITMTARSVGWVNRQASWPYRRAVASLDADALHRQAERFAHRFGVRFDDAYPAPLLEGLDRLAGALRAPEARIRGDRRAAISFELSRKLSNRAALAREYAAQPAIAREPVEQPVFILGINRTGTTFLHRLLAQGGRFWALYPYELAHPALPSSLPSARPEAARRHYSDDILAASGIAEAMSGIHPVDPGEPEEEFALLEDSFRSWTYTLRYFVPGYARWLAARGSAFAYGVHRRTMQHLSWQRGARLGAAPRQWLLKMPFHLAELETLVATYPDAVFIQTHREPREFMPSWLSLTESVRSLTSRSCDPAAIGAEQVEFMSRVLGQAARFRSAYPEIDRRFVDVSYLDLTGDPVRVVEEIYRHFGWTLDDEARTRTERWHARQAARRQTEPRHRYSLDTYGLTVPQVDAAFSAYAEFARSNKVRLA